MPLIQKGVKIYSLIDHKIVINRDVIFDEESYWDWELEKVCNIGSTVEPQNLDKTTIFDVDGTTNTQVLKIKPLSVLYE